MILDGLVIPLYLGHVFIPRYNVDDCTHICLFTPYGFELIIGEDDSDFEASAGICDKDKLEMLEYCDVVHVVKLPY